MSRSCKVLIAGCLSFTFPALAGADLTNIASVSYLDGLGQSHQGMSNTVGVTVVVLNTLPLPPVNLYDLPTSADIHDVLTVSYDSTLNVSFFWSFAPVSPVAGALTVAKTIAQSESFKSGAKTSTLASYGLVPGTYLVTVQAVDNQNADRKSIPTSKTITLVQSDFSQVKVYPNPWRKDKHAGKKVLFDQLPSDTSVKIFTVSGRLAKDLGTVSGVAAWDLTDDSGDPVASGLYVYVITNRQGQKARGKVAVIN